MWLHVIGSLANRLGSDRSTIFQSSAPLAAGLSNSSDIGLFRERSPYEGIYRGCLAVGGYLRRVASVINGDAKVLVATLGDAKHEVSGTARFCCVFSRISLGFFGWLRLGGALPGAAARQH
jgi:hypothetical protein